MASDSPIHSNLDSAEGCIIIGCDDTVIIYPDSHSELDSDSDEDSLHLYFSGDSDNDITPPLEIQINNDICGDDNEQNDETDCSDDTFIFSDWEEPDR